METELCSCDLNFIIHENIHLVIKKKYSYVNLDDILCCPNAQEWKGQLCPKKVSSFFVWVY